MENQTLKIHIANRDYALKVPSPEKAKAAEAEQIIAERIATLKKTHGIAETQDLLALCAFSLAGELIEQKKEIQNIENKITAQVNSIDSLVQNHIQSAFIE